MIRQNRPRRIKREQGMAGQRHFDEQTARERVRAPRETARVAVAQPDAGANWLLPTVLFGAFAVALVGRTLIELIPG
jgi:hypothetical protein